MIHLAKHAPEYAMASIAFAMALFQAFQAGLAPFTAGAGLPVLVVAAPWGPGAARLAELAGGSVIGPEQALVGALATFEEPDPRARLHALGVWTVRDGRRLAAFCGEVTDEQ